MDIKYEILTMYINGKTRKEIAAKFNVTKKYVSYVLENRKNIM